MTKLAIALAAIAGLAIAVPSVSTACPSCGCRNHYQYMGNYGYPGGWGGNQMYGTRNGYNAGQLVTCGCQQSCYQPCRSACNPCGGGGWGGGLNIGLW
jgi:hypothetical protein